MLIGLRRGMHNGRSGFYRAAIDNMGTRKRVCEGKRMKRKEKIKEMVMDGLTTLILMACVYGFMTVAIDKWEENDNAQRVRAHEYLAEHDHGR